MTAQELRIGNKIMANGLHAGQICTVEQIGAKKSLSENKRVIIFAEHQIGEFVSDCDGIPLTPSILERCGFEWETAKKTHLEIDAGDYRFCFYIPKGNIDCMQVYMADGYEHVEFNITHLHQLQNAIHSLTGTELNFKL